MAQRHPKARRTKKQEDGEDAFVAGVLDFSNWARQNQQVLVVAGVVLVILVLGGLYYTNRQGQLVDEAAVQLENIYASVSLGDVEVAKTDLATYLDRFRGTAHEGEARLLLGELYLESDQPQQAIAVLDPLGSSPRSAIELQAATLLAAAYEQEERWAEAEEVYLTIVDRSELDFQIIDALSAAARIRGQHLDDAQGAIALYEEVLAQLDTNSPERGRFEMRIQEIRSALNS